MDNSQLVAKLSQQIPAFSEFFDALRASGMTTWLVGGCVRDLLLGEECADIDVVSSTDPSDWARSWAQGRGYWFWLDQQRRQSRILLADGISFDFAPLRARTITSDLQARDYTINAIAIPINNPAYLFDPLNGIADLKNRHLKMCSTGSFSDDPLRILKGVRHAAVLNFTIEDQTIAAMTQQAQQLKQVAAERIREELLKIVAVRNISYALQMLSRTTVLPMLFGASKTSWSDKDYSANHQSLFDRLDDFCGQYQLAVSKELLQQRPLYQLATLLMAYTDAQPFYPDLRLSRAQQRLLIALGHDLPAAWLQQLRQVVSERQRALAVEQLGPYGMERVFYHGWCRGKLQQETVIALLMGYEQHRINGRIPDLIDGHVIAQYVGTENKIIGELLQQIKTLERAGRIRSIEDAHRWLQAHFGFDKN
ncbi:CCA tRNA nucleotidyltransferase [Pelovirga terrestris]|uniref:CCA tRNA nucleotidyltransferase n=1 Tax=Pelovirga terrestris TaxID=2771352 RepID=A0A8J6UNC0_9BACT|nr:CCA tRNA nucleotidyltransferase [Pelovirga terrestris]MBD1399239.1 CCA tRNA nucleotidyltransferase [Pelovirga terrestris]